MIAEALKFLVGLHDRAAAPQKLDVADPRSDVYLVGGEVLRIDRGVAPRDHEVETLDDLIALAVRFQDAGRSPVVWYDDGAVRLVIDDAEARLERATLVLERTEAYRTLARLDEQKPWMEQKPFVRLLRVDLAGTLEPVHLLEKVRRVKFATESSTSGVVTRERESMGREINSRAEAAEGAIPEEVTLMASVFLNPGLVARRPIRCAVDVDPARGLFQLHPMPDALGLAVADAVIEIGDALGRGLGEGIPAYYGRP